MICIEMSMPERCYECRFRLTKPYSAAEHRCVADNGHIINTSIITKKPEWCPLTEVVMCSECKHAIMTTDGDFCKYCKLEEDENGLLTFFMKPLTLSFMSSIFRRTTTQNTPRTSRKRKPRHDQKSNQRLALEERIRAYQISRNLEENGK